MKTMCPSSYHRNSFLATDAFGSKIAQLAKPEASCKGSVGTFLPGRAHCFHDCIYITSMLFF